MSFAFNPEDAPSAAEAEAEVVVIDEDDDDPPSAAAAAAEVVVIDDEDSGDDHQSDRKLPAIPTATTTMTTKIHKAAASSNISNNDDEEAKLLASLEASREDQDVYEDAVLREATHQLAPRLEIQTGAGGFPSLATLVSNNTKNVAAPAGRFGQRSKKQQQASSLPAVHAVLEKVRNQLSKGLSDPSGNKNMSRLQRRRMQTSSSSSSSKPLSEDELDLLQLKEQMLLMYLHTEAGVAHDDLPIRRTEQRWFELRRQQTLNHDDSKPASLSQQARSKQRGGGGGRRSVRHMEEDNADDEENPSVTTNSQQPLQRGRVSMMERKKRAAERESSLGESAGSRVLLATPLQAKELRQAREERRKRKLARRQRWSRQEKEEEGENELEQNDNHQANSKPPPPAPAADQKDGTEESLPEAEAVVVVDTTEAATTAEEEPTPTQQLPQQLPQVAQEASAGGGSESAETTEPLVCPLCQTPVPCEDPSKRDLALSAHMDACQRPTTRRSTRRRQQRTFEGFVDSHAVENENGGDKQDGATDDDEDEAYGPSAKRTSQVETIDNTASAELEGLAKGPPRKKQKRGSTSSAAAAGKVQSEDNDAPTKPSALDDLETWVYEDRVDDWIEHGLERMRKMTEQDEGQELVSEADYGAGLILPAWINQRLFGYQRDGLRIMWRWHTEQAGGILGDEMGLGKTVSVCSFLGSLASCRLLASVLLVVPATMLNHWLKELATWAPGLRRILIHPSGEVDGISRAPTKKLFRSLDKWIDRCRRDRVYECIDEEDRQTMPPHAFCGTGYVVLTTYENVRRNPEVYTDHRFDYAVLDEAQKIRNHDADITAACKRVRTPHRIAMSGTPIMNDLKELWSLFDFVFPGRLGTLPAFEQEFADPIRKGGYSNASTMQVQLAYRCALVLRELIEPYLLRRLKKEVKEVSRMPSKTEQVLFCRLSKRQRTLYEAFLQSDTVSKAMRGSTNLLGAITMLRKISNHPDLVCEPSDSALDTFIKNGCVPQSDVLDDDEGDGEDSDDDHDYQESLTERSGKLEVLSKILPLWKKQGHRVLIFCQWRKMLNIIQKYMLMMGWKFGRLDGNTNVAARQRLVDEFNADESYFAMLCTTRTGGVGLNLTGASRVCLYSPDWNPQIDAQARERAWRFGQTKEVTVYRLITAGTVEEKIYQRQIFKTALSNKVLSDPRQRRLFSQRDLRDLFSLKQDGGSIRSGGDGVTETGSRTKGGGVVDVDAPQENNESNIREVMKSRGLAGIFDHDFVEGDPSTKTASAREMEEEAKKVARDAVRALEHSMKGQARPLGGSNTKRFGTGNFGMSHGGAGPASSSSLLSTIKQRNESVRNAGTKNESKANVDEYATLLGRIKEYVRKRRPTTEDILRDFADVKNADVAIFRQLLKSTAKLVNGRWVLTAR